MLKKLIFTSVVILLIVTLAVSCSSEKSLAEQTDSIVIRLTPDPMYPPACSITDPDEIQQLITFFEGLSSLRELSEEETSPFYYLGTRPDFIDFMRDGEVICQYVMISRPYFVRFESEGPWYEVTWEDGKEWDSLIEGLKSEAAK